MKKLALGLSTLLFAAPAHAHIRVLNMTSRDGDAMKEGPCGKAGSSWGASGSTTLEPGATMTITIDEYVPHPGYFRIAFGQDSDFKDPVSIQPIDVNRKHVSARDQDTGSDFCSNPTVLMDNLDAHMSGGGQRTYTVKLPDIACDRCSLQIIQVMEDPIHGAYNLEVGGGEFDLPDLYHQCVDVTLERGNATPSGEKPACTIGSLVGGQTSGAGASDAGSQPTVSKSDDGCALHHGDASWLATGLALWTLRRKKTLAILRPHVHPMPPISSASDRAPTTATSSGPAPAARA
jgi:hypothetical protein